jgi:hypothetical protein
MKVSFSVSRNILKEMVSKEVQCTLEEGRGRIYLSSRQRRRKIGEEMGLSSLCLWQTSANEWKAVGDRAAVQQVQLWGVKVNREGM